MIPAPATIPRTTIRDTVPSDFRQVGNLLVLEQMLRGSMTQERFNSILEKNKGFCLVAETNGNVVGTAFGSHDVLTGHISKVVVDKAYRGKGVGKAMVKELTKRLREAGVDLIYLHTRRDNRAAINFFQKCGFMLRQSHYLVDMEFERPHTMQFPTKRNDNPHGPGRS